MLFNQAERAAIARGELTEAYRHWRPGRPQAVAGARHRLAPFGMIEILEVGEADPATLTARNAKAAGFVSREALLDDIEKWSRKYAGNDLYRVAFRFVAAGEPGAVDSRAVLASDDALSAEDVAVIAAKLDRMDARSAAGPWTRETLRLIAEHPGRRAGDLADMAGRERLEFKRDVRKLKELGLTLSLEVGYELSPRGRAFVTAIDKRASI
jgi:hypothetical protein